MSYVLEKSLGNLMERVWARDTEHLLITAPSQYFTVINCKNKMLFVSDARKPHLKALPTSPCLTNEGNR